VFIAGTFLQPKPGLIDELHMILLLEDAADRLRRFAGALRALDPALELKTWRSARRMVRDLDAWLPAAGLLSLDHDLEPGEGDADPGDGLEVVRFLVRRSQVCPVIIHSSNRQRSDWMAGELDLAGWRHHRVAPLGDDWIEEHWIRVVGRLLRRPTGSGHPSR
jgi:hypothetical protein